MKNISPFAIGISIILIIGLIMQIPFNQILTEDYFSSFQIEYIALTLKMSMIFVVSLIGIKKFQVRSLSGLSFNYKWTSKLLNVIPAYLFLIGISSFMGKNLTVIQIPNLFLLLLACLSVGFAEEFMFRGLLQSLFIQKYISKKNSLFFMVLYPAIFFGVSHLLNLMVNPNIPQVIVQAVYAVFIGFFFGVLLLKTNKLIPIAITHGLINFFFLFNSLPSMNNSVEIETEPQIQASFVEQILGYAIPLLMFVPLFIIGIIILKKIKKEQIQKKIDK
ncbi:CPBP family intramembrane glutamic endopeptidase [Aquimarina algicola]|uniref:CPBP family intramembrane metalloprotease n=1 Tax=Aquimarina algicola TaxID=2589995 RepID=A0A504J9D5_9FLAO|nr:CPBP family intramembrane glutamic endopeptidase [Aquimarina algicola]TPN87234.1 CPBP family intramembrane metalloprotease [Aquimarina algicola]